MLGRPARCARRIVLTAALALITAACVSSQDAGKPFPSEARRKLVINQTTKREVQTLLGPPLSMTTGTEGEEKWIYEHTRVSARRLLPFGRNVTVQQTPHEQLTLTFRDDKLNECVYVAQEYRTEGMVTVPTRTLRERCGTGAGAPRQQTENQERVANAGQRSGGNHAG